MGRIIRKPMVRGMSEQFHLELQRLHREIREDVAQRCGEEQRLRDSVTALAARMGAQMPDHISLYRDTNGLAYSSDEYSSISIGYGAHAALDKKEMEVLLGHELSHIKHDDTRRGTRQYERIKSIYNGVGSVVALAGIYVASHVVHGYSSLTDTAAIGVAVGTFAIGARQVAKDLLMPIVSVTSRRNERRADIESAKLAGAVEAIRLLLKGEPGEMTILGKLLYGAGPSDEKRSLADTVKYGLSYMRYKLHSFRFDSHPNTEQRVRNVIKYAKKHGFEAQHDYE